MVSGSGLAFADSLDAAFELGHPIVPREGYDWSGSNPSYFPADEWLSESPADHRFDLGELEKALDLARNDGLMRAVLIVRDGRIVVEEYLHGGAEDQSTEVWSVTKSIVSALIGIALQNGHIDSIDDLMSKYLPEYPEFGDLTIRHVLTHTTGLEWTEEGDDFVEWIASSDPVANALRRERRFSPGEKLVYSSGNSHFLSVLIHRATGATPGEYAQKYIFGPLDIQFHVQDQSSGQVAWGRLPDSHTAYLETGQHRHRVRRFRAQHDSAGHGPVRVPLSEQGSLGREDNSQSGLGDRINAGPCSAKRKFRLRLSLGRIRTWRSSCV